MRTLSAALIFTLTSFALHADDAANTGTNTFQAGTTAVVTGGTGTTTDTGTIVVTGGTTTGTNTFDAPVAQNKWADATFLGLVTEPISLERAGDLGLPAGSGLSVVVVSTDTPASKAGLQPGDVLTKLDDQLLVNPAQLRVLVRMRKGGDTVAFQIVRKGKTQEIKAALASRKMPPLTPGGEEPRMLLPREFKMNPGQGGIQIKPFGGNLGQLPPEILQQIPPEMRERVLRAQAQALGQAPPVDLDGGKNEATVDIDSAPGDAPHGGMHFSSRSISKDGTHTIEIEHGKVEHMNITDSAGKKIYNGKIPATDKEWEEVPEEARAKAKAMAANQPGVNIYQGMTTMHGGAAIKATDDKPAEAKPGQSF